MFHKQECVFFCFYINSCSAENTDTALFSGVYPSVASDRSYYLRIITICDINRPKWLPCIQNAGKEKFRTNTKSAKMNGNTFFVRARSEGVCVFVRARRQYLLVNPHIFYCFRRVHKMSVSVRPSTRPHERLAFHWTDFHEISYLSIFLKPAEKKTQVLLKSDKNNQHFT